eukprot:8407616-Ditylum_brightwellii.AAC.1
MQLVDTTLGGGANGHLGLVCDASTYSSILGTAVYVRPSNPAGQLVVPVGTAAQFVQARDQHEEAL